MEELAATFIRNNIYFSVSLSLCIGDEIENIATYINA